LVISNSFFESGAEYSLYELIVSNTKKYRYFITTPNNSKNSFRVLLSCKTYYLPYSWLCKSITPLPIAQYIYSLVVTTFRLYRIIKKNDIQIIYANTVKSAIYGLFVKCLINRRLVCHVRDNVKSRILKKLLIKRSDVIISISRHIYEQFSSDLKSNYLIYGGIDTEKWRKTEDKVEKMSLLASTSILIACIGQITGWKNQTDFIHVAKNISDKHENVYFVIIGEDLSGREKKYKNELLKLVKSLNLQDRIQFLGHREDIKEVMNGIDILVHPAIDEPFGRVLIEAMALEKPVVAYNCGGPAEIILDGETGFLVEPHNFEQLAEKTMKLIDDKELCIRMEKAGRQRVVEKFNIERYVREMEAVFDDLMECG
jgi:glycosyltransferase involved in cell wall biosynthesis